MKPLTAVIVLLGVFALGYLVGATRTQKEWVAWFCQDHNATLVQFSDTDQACIYDTKDGKVTASTR